MNSCRGTGGPISNRSPQPPDLRAPGPAYDIRAGSPTYGQWVAETLTPDNGKQLWIPPGFAHGFCSLEPDSVICYKVTDYYSPECDKGLAWDDPTIGIQWPDVADVDTLSLKDRKQPLLSDLPAYFA